MTEEEAARAFLDLQVDGRVSGAAAVSWVAGHPRFAAPRRAEAESRSYVVLGCGLGVAVQRVADAWRRARRLGRGLRGERSRGREEDEADGEMDRHDVQAEVPAGARRGRGSTSRVEARF